MNRPLLLSVLALASCAGPGAAQHTRKDYALDKPERIFALPSHLREISALTDMDERTVAALQDEIGTIYFIDHTNGRIQDSLHFAGPGDYEGLTRVGQDLYALRSDGLIFHLRHADHGYAAPDTFRLHVPNRNLESLGYDERNGILLVAAKDNLKGGPEVRDHRYVHGWDLRTNKQLEQPVLDLSLDQVIRKAQTLGVRLPRERKKNGKEITHFKLRPSSVAVHPEYDDYWILSAADHTLLVVDRTGQLTDLIVLDPKLFPKAEGITFLANGDLLISNEGHGEPADLLFFPKR
ncbi:MAG TPA: hypothetical protein VGE21_06500 [Flavobacteriales bacterium]